MLHVKESSGKQLERGIGSGKPKPVNLNLASFRKVPSQEARDPNSSVNQSLDQHGVSARNWKQIARATNEGPLMYAQERQKYEFIQIPPCA